MSDTSDRFTVDGLVGGKRVRKVVTGRSTADHEADKIRAQGGSDVGWTREGWTTPTAGGQKTVRVSGHTKKDGTQVRGYTQNRDAAKGEWDAKKYQAATAVASAVIALATAMASIVGILSEVTFMILMVIVLFLNVVVKMLTKPRSTPRRVMRRTARRTTRHVVRRRGPARKTVRRR